MKRKGFNESKLLRKLDEEIRNVQIVTSWEMLTEFTQVAYKDKVQYLMDQYGLSFSRIEDIISMSNEKD